MATSEYKRRGHNPLRVSDARIRELIRKNDLLNDMLFLYFCQRGLYEMQRILDSDKAIPQDVRPNILQGLRLGGYL